MIESMEDLFFRFFILFFGSGDPLSLYFLFEITAPKLYAGLVFSENVVT